MAPNVEYATSETMHIASSKMSNMGSVNRTNGMHWYSLFSVDKEVRRPIIEQWGNANAESRQLIGQIDYRMNAWDLEASSVLASFPGVGSDVTSLLYIKRGSACLPSSKGQTRPTGFSGKLGKTSTHDIPLRPWHAADESKRHGRLNCEQDLRQR